PHGQVVGIGGPRIRPDGEDPQTLFNRFWQELEQLAINMVVDYHVPGRVQFDAYVAKRLPGEMPGDEHEFHVGRCFLEQFPPECHPIVASLDSALAITIINEAEVPPVPRLYFGAMYPDDDRTTVGSVIEHRPQCP